MLEPQTITVPHEQRTPSVQDRDFVPSPVQAAESTGPQPFAWLEAALQSGSDHATVVAQRAYRLRAVQVDAPLLVVPLAGVKRLEVDGKSAEVVCGRFVILHQACRMGVENLPPHGAADAYRAWVVSFPWRVVALARSLVDAHRNSGAVVAAGAAKPDCHPESRARRTRRPLHRLRSASARITSAASRSLRARSPSA